MSMVRGYITNFILGLCCVVYTMTKSQLFTGVTASIVVLAVLLFISAMLQRFSGELHPSTFALIGWVSGMVGLFVAGSSD